MDPTNRKKSRACLECRSMKIKCVPIPGSSKCEACLRHMRPCESPGPTKPRMKPTEKFQELEKRIEVLTDALQTERQWPAPSHQLQDSITANDSLYSNDELMEASWTGAPVIVSPRLQNGDVIDDGVVHVTMASALFNHWRDNIRPIFPIIQLAPEETEFNDIRKSKPALFLAILTVSSASFQPVLINVLLPRLNSLLAEQVFVLGNKSIDLLQSLILFSQYHLQLTDAKGFPLTQHLYGAMAMASDLMLEDKIKMTEAEPTPMTLQACRLLLSIYFAASASSTFLRRSQFNPFQPLYESYIKILTDASAPDSDDALLCKLVSLQHISEDASLSLNQLFNVEADSFDNAKTRALFNLLQYRVSEWGKSQNEVHLTDPSPKNIARFSVELQTHQVAIRDFNHRMAREYDNVELRGGDLKLPSITAVHFQSLSRCLELSQDILNTYTSLNIGLARSLPNIFLLYIMYAGVCLAKLGGFLLKYVHSQSPDTNNDEDEYAINRLLDAVSRRLSEISEDGYLPPARHFAQVFRKLTTWQAQKQSFCINFHIYKGCREIPGPVHDVLTGEIVGTAGPLQHQQSLEGPHNPVLGSTDLIASGSHGTGNDGGRFAFVDDNSDGNSGRITAVSSGASTNDAGEAIFSVEEMQDFEMSMMYNNYFWMSPFLR